MSDGRLTPEHAPFATERDSLGRPVRFCPKGHKMGTRFNGVRCTLSRCGEEGLTEAALATQQLEVIAALPPEEHAFATRKALAGLPAGLKGDAAAKWASDKLVDLLPEAVASVAYDLRHGTDKVRAEAADKVLRANGLDKREAQQTQGGLIILSLGSEAKSVPWLERTLNVSKKADE